VLQYRTNESCTRQHGYAEKEVIPVAKYHARPSAQYRYEHYDPRFM
jgi:hypothetical protein